MFLRVWDVTLTVSALEQAADFSVETHESTKTDRPQP
jgi:hypothetical protein